MNDSPAFSVVIPSRNRPILLRSAIGSVLAQSLADIEVIVVNDGSDADFADEYTRLAEEFAGRVQMINLQRTANGHGPSYAINRGVDKARGEFVCFLDDDDSWTDPGHLSRVVEAAARCPDLDYYLACQDAFQGESRVEQPLWLNGLAEKLIGMPAEGPSGEVRVTVPALLQCDTFAHLNTMVVRRSLYQRTGGMDESIRYECEWDLYFRLIEHARLMLYFPGVIARHNVPDPKLRNNASTVVPDLHKLLLRIRVMDKALLLSSSGRIRYRAAEVKTMSLKRIAALLADRRDWQGATHYAGQALMSGFNLKWLGYWGYLWMRSVMPFRTADANHQGAKS